MIKDRTILILFGASLLLLVISAVVGFTGLPQEAGGPLIIRFDTSGDQVTLLGGVGIFFGLLGVAAAIAAVNFVLALEMYGKERFLSYILASGTLIITVVFLIVAYTITAAN